MWGFFLYFLSGGDKPNRKNFEFISSQRILFFLYYNSISRRLYVLLWYKHIKIRNTTNISKRFRYGKDLFLPWTRKLRNGTYVACTLGGSFAQIDIWLLSKNLLVQLGASGYEFLQVLVLHCYFALLHPGCLQITWVCPSNLRY